jgi:hypothetical protein
MGQAEGVAQFVDSCFFQPRQHQLDGLNLLMEPGLQAVQRHQRAATVDLGEAEDKSEDRNEKVNMRDAQVLDPGRQGPWLKLAQNGAGVILAPIFVKGAGWMVPARTKAARQSAAPGDAPGQVLKNLFFHVTDGKDANRCGGPLAHSGF